MKYTPKSVEQYRAQLDKDTTRKRGKFKVGPRAMLNSPAFASLNRSGMIVVLAMLDHLEYYPKNSTNSKGVKLGGEVVKNGGEFTLTNNELKARGLKSDGAIRDGKKEAWEKGFLDVVTTGTLFQAFKGRVSKRWRQFPNGDYLPHNQPPTGKQMYPGGLNKGGAT